MDYKKNLRSPNYGRIFAYDQNGREINEIDILKVQLEYKGRTYKIKDLLELVVEDNLRIADYEQLQRETLQNKQKIQTLSELAVLLDAKIAALGKK